MDDDFFVASPRGPTMIRFLNFVILGLILAAAVGCVNHRPPPPPPPVPQPLYPPPPGYPPPGAVVQPPPGAMVLPPPPNRAQGQFPTAPQAGPPPSFPTAPQSGFPTAPQTGAPPPPMPPVSTGPPTSVPGVGLDRVGYGWRPNVPPTSPQTGTNPYSPSPAPLVPPAPSAAPSTNEPPQANGSPQANVFLLPPKNDSAEPPTNSPKVALYPPDTTTPSTPNTPRASSFPVGIAGYDRVRPGGNVTTGSRPSLEGLDWLKREGIATVVFVHLPGAAVEPDRDVVKRRGMTFIDLEFDPKNLDKRSVDEFLRLQRDGSLGKVFVYDDVEGAVTGALWYLSFRTIDLATDEEARIRAGSLGLRENRDGNPRDMWQAVRTYLNQ
jgi:hypothetical protein